MSDADCSDFERDNWRSHWGRFRVDGCVGWLLFQQACK